MKYIYYLNIILLLYMLSSCSGRDNNTSVSKNDTSENQKAYITTSVFKSDSGWGYNILINNKIIIHQSHIPAISGLHTFSSPSKAKKVAEYVAQMIHEKNTIYPITYQELEELGVLDSLN